MKYNYHTHCNLTPHASGEIEDYILKAINNGYKIIGFSEHMPTLLNRNNRVTAIDFYLKYLPKLREFKEKYKDKITIRVGVEVEYEPRFANYHQVLKSNVDYLILGEHEFLIDGKMCNAYQNVDENFINHYAELIIEALNTGNYAILAHPELFRVGHNGIWDEVSIEASKRIIEASIKNNVYLEINANGLRHRKIKGTIDQYYYPYDKFFILAKQMGAKFIIGDDSHTLDEFCDEYTKKAQKFALDLGLQIEEIIKI